MMQNEKIQHQNPQNVPTNANRSSRGLKLVVHSSERKSRRVPSAAVPPATYITNAKVAYLRDLRRYQMHIGELQPANIMFWRE
mmetsp:Transcript_11974/g.29000  ORF Transcript_11974/g.29000 Transcript_11974/m.29000 type:complete len:83 (-) Transcript_11974:360-608(-)